MMTYKEIAALAELARLELTEEEAQSYTKDFQDILSYVDMIQSIDLNQIEKPKPKLHSVVREDDDAYTAGQFSREILDVAPEQQDGYVKVPNIL